MSYLVGDWIKYKETWTKEKNIAIDEIGLVHKIKEKFNVYMTTRGYAVTDSMIIEARAKAYNNGQDRQ